MLLTAPKYETANASGPEARPGDLVIQFGQLPFPPEFSSLSFTNEPSDRIDIVDGRTGLTIAEWETFLPSVSGIDASRGDGVYLAVNEELTPNTFAYAAKIAPDGTLDDFWVTAAPDQITSGGIATNPGGEPLVGGSLWDGSSEINDVFVGTGSTTFDTLGVTADGPTTVIGVTESWIAYLDGEVIKLARLSDGELLDQMDAPWYLVDPGTAADARLTPDGLGVLIAPGEDAAAELLWFVDLFEPVLFQIPDEPDCYPVSADMSYDRVYVLTSCEWGDAEIYMFARTGEFIGLVKSYDAEDLETLGSYPVRLRVYGLGPGSQDGPIPVIYVHGTREEARAESPLTKVLDHGTLTGRISVRHFHYWQDAAGQDGCTQTADLPTSLPTPQTTIPVDGHASGGWNQLCDSQSSIAHNTLLLHELIQELYWEDRRPVILVGYSMGAAIIRGALTYSGILEDGVAERMIDTVITVAGAHDGSWYPHCALSPDACPSLGSTALKQALKIKFDLSRPAVHELAAQSEWYGWANSIATSLPQAIGYYNVYANWEFKLKVCLFGKCSAVYHNENFGDGILFPGTSYPYDTPDEGGARFLPTAYERGELVAYVPGLPKFDRHAVYASSVLSYPAFHSEIPGQADNLAVRACRLAGWPVSVPLNYHILFILQSRVLLDSWRLCPIGTTE